MRVLAFDPGLTGALAYLAHRGGGFELQVWDMPVLAVMRGRSSKGTIADYELAEILRDPLLPPIDHVVIENVATRPGQSVSAMGSFMRGVGRIEGVVAALGLARSYVQPAAWKRGVGLPTGASKDESRALAQSKFPKQAGLFRLHKHEGRAEAALIALYAHGVLSTGGALRVA